MVRKNFAEVKKYQLVKRGYLPPFPVPYPTYLTTDSFIAEWRHLQNMRLEEALKFTQGHISKRLSKKLNRFLVKIDSAVGIGASTSVKTKQIF